ncbi:MAG: hypothetical protein ACTSQI_20535 [Candidatus Helarchaeota archaeon]
MLEKRKKGLDKKFAIFIVGLCFSLNICILISLPHEKTVQNDNLWTNQTLLLQAEQPNITAVSSNSQYFKNGDTINLIVTCDQANYSIIANFSTIDSEFSPSEVQVTDFNNNTYLVCYAINDSNIRPDGLYQILINATNSTSGLSQLYNDTSLTLDNTVPNIYFTSPSNGAFLLSNNITIEGYMNATFSLIKQISLNDTRFELLINRTGEDGGNFMIINKSIITEGPVAIKIDLKDSVDLTNSSILGFVLDNTPPRIDGDIFVQFGDYLILNLTVRGTYSPMTYFEYNMSEFQVFDNKDPVGKLEDVLLLYNSPLPDGYYILNATISDSVNLSSSIFINFMIDTTPPFYEAIIQNTSQPEYYNDVNISIINPTDLVSGISTIILNYTTNDWASWYAININSTKYAVIPAQPYSTIVKYRIHLIDKQENPNNTQIFSYFVSDNIVPVVENIQAYPINPTKRKAVNISIGNVFDLGSGVAGIFLNYSLDGGANWKLINITENGWGVIEAQPRGTTVHYQIIVNDTAGNIFKSEMLSYTVRFDINRFLIFLVIIAAIAGISGYSGKLIYTKHKNKTLKLKFAKEREEIASFIEFRLTDLGIILNDIEIIEANLEKLLMYKWVPDLSDVKSKKTYDIQVIKEYIGISQLESEIHGYETTLIKKLQAFNKKYSPLKPTEILTPMISKFNEKINVATISLEELTEQLSAKYPILLQKKTKLLTVKYPLNEFDSKFAKIINRFQDMYKALEKEFDQLLISRKIKIAEARINKFTSLYDPIDEWFNTAEQWANTLPLPKDRGYKYLLKLKKDQYESIKNQNQMKVEKLRAELTSSIRFAQNFIQWNYNNVVNRLNQFESTISEELLRLISSEETEFQKITAYINDKFDIFTAELMIDKEKIRNFAETHKEFHIQEIYDDWLKLMNGIIPTKLHKIRNELDDFIKPLYRIDSLVKGITKYFYNQSIKEIEKYKANNTVATILNESVGSLKALFSKIVWKINSVDNTIEDWINLLPYDLKTPQLIILLRTWNESKDAILQKLNELSNEQRIYKCEIMHEILDPLNDEIWECSNCGAIACTEHLEKWYHRKNAPECFKCGNSNTFQLKQFPD